MVGSMTRKRRAGLWKNELDSVFVYLFSALYVHEIPFEILCFVVNLASQCLCVTSVFE